MNNLHENMSGKNINFLIGSGASAPLLPTLNLGKNLPSFEELVTSSRLNESNKKLLYAYYFDKWIYQMQNIPHSVEYEIVSKNYLNFINTILDILEREASNKPKRVNIFTTNYDLLFEETFDDVNQINPLCFFNDGSKGFIKQTLNTENFYLNVSHSGYNDIYKREVPTINLLKMHGSISWKNEKEKIYVEYLNSSLVEVKKSLDLIKKYDSNKIEVILDVVNLDRINSIQTKIDIINYLISSLRIDQSEIENFNNNYIKIPIINPDKWKFHDTVFEQHYYQMIRAFSYELEKKDTVLIIFGFSFADEHILEIFKRSLLNPTLQIFIIAFTKATKVAFESIFSGYNNITYLPVDFEDEDGNIIYGNFDFLNEALRGSKQCKTSM